MRCDQAAALFAAFSILAAACSDKPGTPLVPDASRDFQEDSAAVIDTSGPCTDAGSGTTFSDLYRDIFSDTTGVARCQNSGCHGDPTQQSGLKMHATKDEMYTAITTFTTSYHKVGDDLKSPLYVLVVKGPTAFTESGLMRMLDPDNADPGMPRVVGNSAKRAAPLDHCVLERIATWLKNGAKND